MAGGEDWLEVESLDLEAQGVARRADGKVVFVEGALPGERVQVQVSRKKNAWEQGPMSALARESAQRVRPGCPHFGLHAGACGGCKMQHLHPAAQVAVMAIVQVVVITVGALAVRVASVATTPVGNRPKHALGRPQTSKP